MDWRYFNSCTFRGPVSLCITIFPHCVTLVGLVLHSTNTLSTGEGAGELELREEKSNYFFRECDVLYREILYCSIACNCTVERRSLLQYLEHNSIMHSGHHRVAKYSTISNT